MDGRRITLTPGTTLHFDSLGFVYTRLVESVAGRTFTWPFPANVLTGAAGREAFVRGFSDDVIIIMLGPVRHGYPWVRTDQAHGRPRQVGLTYQKTRRPVSGPNRPSW
jgi:hypothetical protein